MATRILDDGPRFVGCDQYGQTYWINKHPRKELMARLCCKRAQKMYVGDCVHIGYVIGDLWIRVWRVSPLSA